MKYTDALKIYNQGKSKWCSPRKGSKDYYEVKKIQGVPVVVLKKKTKVAKVAKVAKELSKKPKSISKKVFLKDVIKAESKTPEAVEVSRNSISKKNSKANRIQRFLKNKLIVNKFTLDNRVKFSKYLQARLKSISDDDCLETKIFKDGVKGYTIKNTIDLVKKIGTESAFGAIYLSNIKDGLGGYSIISKVMAASKDNLQEIKLMRLITDKLLITKKSKHFAAVHKHAICNSTVIKNHEGNKIIMPPRLKLVSINELAHGDLKTLVKNRDVAGNTDLMLNLLFQVFISIGTFQNLVGYVHNDAHHGNFLYQKNNEKGYYEYEFNGKKYYLKACGYNMMIYDFGLSKNISTAAKLKQNENKITQDYYRIIHAFLSKSYGWGDYYDLPLGQCDTKVISMRKILMDIMIECNTKKINKTSKEIFKNILEKVLIPHASTDMFLTSKPNSNIINSTPYKIN